MKSFHSFLYTKLDLLNGSPSLGKHVLYGIFNIIILRGRAGYEMIFIK